MKVSRIEIKDFQQFKDFELDLTYPEGHAKAGQPLDKVCFIGQSGTGKTTILNEIATLIEVTKDINHVKNKVTQENLAVRLNYSSMKDNREGFSIRYRYLDSELYYHEITKGNFNKPEAQNHLLFFQTGLENHEAILLGKLKDTKPAVHTAQDETIFLEQVAKYIQSYKKIIKLCSNTHFKHDEFRIFLLNILDNYDRKNIQKLQQLTKTLDPKVLEEVQQWKLQNPRIELGKKLATILSKFNLQLDIEWADGGLKIKTLQDTEVEISAASTGTKQILLSAIPLALMETANKIILFDEPERSLFPDIQQTLINYYTELAPEAQFFFATHSPIIASQFEPWEIVELKFDENGNVYREKFYEGENNVENYTIFPQYLRWDSILTKVFDMEYNSNEARNGKLNELTALEVKLRKLKEKGGANQEEILELWEKYEHLANLLDWQLNEKNR